MSDDEGQDELVTEEMLWDRIPQVQGEERANTYYELSARIFALVNMTKRWHLLKLRAIFFQNLAMPLQKKDLHRLTLQSDITSISSSGWMKPQLP